MAEWAPEVGMFIRERQRDARPRQITFVRDNGDIVTAPAIAAKRGRVTVIRRHRLQAFDVLSHTELMAARGTSRTPPRKGQSNG